MVSHLGTAFGTGAALLAKDAVASAATAFCKWKETHINWERYTKEQRRQLETYRSYCADTCGQQAHKEYFEFDAEAGRPKRISSELDTKARPENCDTPFNLSAERRQVHRAVAHAHAAMIRAQDGNPLYQPEVYVMCELKKWASGLSVDASHAAEKMLNARAKYLDKVVKFSRDHGNVILGIKEIVEGVNNMLESCRKKVLTYNWKQLLPRVHGEANAISESMRLVLQSVLHVSPEKMRCWADRSQLFSRLTAGNQSTTESFPDSVCTVVHSIFLDEGEATRAAIIRLHEKLTVGTQEVADISNRVFSDLLLWSDALQNTLASHVDAEVVTECGHLASIVQQLSLDLGTLRGYCDSINTSRHNTRVVKAWRATYADVKDDIDDVQEAVSRFRGYIPELYAYFKAMENSEHSSLKRSIEQGMFPGPKLKKLKID